MASRGKIQTKTCEIPTKRWKSQPNAWDAPFKTPFSKNCEVCTVKSSGWSDGVLSKIGTSVDRTPSPTLNGTQPHQPMHLCSRRVSIVLLRILKAFLDAPKRYQKNRNWWFIKKTKWNWKSSFQEAKVHWEKSWGVPDRTKCLVYHLPLEFEGLLRQPAYPEKKTQDPRTKANNYFASKHMAILPAIFVWSKPTWSLIRKSDVLFLITFPPFLTRLLRKHIVQSTLIAEFSETVSLESLQFCFIKADSFTISQSCLHPRQQWESSQICLIKYQTEIKKTNSSDSRLNSVKYLLCKLAVQSF